MKVLLQLDMQCLDDMAGKPVLFSRQMEEEWMGRRSGVRNCGWDVLEKNK